MFMRSSLTALALMLTVSTAYAETEALPQVPVPSTVTMLDLGSTSCSPCTMMEPILESVRTHYEGKAAIVFIDVREHPEMKAKYGIKSIPTQIFYDKDGKERERHVGFLEERRIKRRIDALLAE